jgi:hypothetical protein
MIPDFSAGLNVPHASSLLRNLLLRDMPDGGRALPVRLSRATIYPADRAQEGFAPIYFRYLTFWRFDPVIRQSDNRREGNDQGCH